MFRMLGHIKRHLRAVAGALLLLSLLASIPLIKEINADDGGAGSTVTATVRIGLNNLEVTLSGPDTVSVGETFRVEAVLKNTGSTRIRNAEATILLPEGIAINGGITQPVGAIGAGREKDVDWRAVSDTPGSYIFVVSAVGEDADAGGPVTAEASIVVEVIDIVHAMEVELSVPETVDVGDRFDVEATIINAGSSNISGIEAVINIPDGFRLMRRGSDMRRIENLRAGKDRKVTWTVVAGIPGSYAISVTASRVSTRGGVIIEAEASAAIEVRGIVTAEDDENDAQAVTATFGTLRVTVDAPATVGVGRRFSVTAVIRNSSSTEVTLLGAEIHLPEGVSLDDDDGEGAAADADLGALGPDEEKKIEWPMLALAPGNYVVVVSVTWLEEASVEPLDGEIRLTLEATDISEGDDAGRQGIVGFASRVWKGLRDLFTGIIMNT